MYQGNTVQRGFTLIELSIVLVIIGLIVGGVLTGQSLIAAAAVRAQISQIEKFNTAVNTFYGKYGALPGDLDAEVATKFGFTARGPYAGEGDGNGMIEGVGGEAPGLNGGYLESTGETVMFWVDLTTANGLNINIIDGSFRTASPATLPSGDITGSALNAYFPAAKIGGGNFVYVFSTGSTGSSGVNYFGLSAISSIGTSYCGTCLASTPGLTVSQAYSVDKKIDDGLPQWGNVTAMYLNNSDGYTDPIWAAGGGGMGDAIAGAPTTAASAGTSATCYDNGNVAGATQRYSVDVSGGSNVNCALSFRMQAGD